MIDFSDKFVCATRERAGFDRFVPSPVFRKSFTLERLPDSAKLLICGLGFYELFVNGKKITKGLLAPYISNPDDIVYYDLYDLRSELMPGENVIGVICGNGFNNPLTHTWEFNAARHASSPKLALSFDAGEVCFDATSFVCTESEIFFDNMRTGAFVDARRANDGRFAPGFDDSGWRRPLRAEPPRGVAKLCECEPVRVIEERAPISVVRGELKQYDRKMPESESLLLFENAEPFAALPDELRRFEGKVGADRDKTDCTGGYIYDFGVNDTGTFRLKVHGERGQVITIASAECLDDSGRVDPGSIEIFCPPGFFQRCVYICRGAGEEIFEMPFSYWGCRYLYVWGLDEAQAEGALTFLAAHSDVKTLAHFSCSDKDANALYEIAERSDLSNFNYFPTDCPHREKNGWTGDASMSSEHMLLTLGVESSFREWLFNIRAAQKQDGSLPGIVPTAGWGYAWGNGPAWDSVLFNLPWFCYVYRGRIDIVRECAHSMMSYLDYIARRRDERGLVHIGLGDWVPTLDRENQSACAYRTPLELTDSVMVFDMARKASAMFEAIGEEYNARYAKELADEMRDAVREHLIDMNTMIAHGATMTGQAVIIYFGILDPGEAERAARALVRMIRAAGDGFDCGMLGLRSVFHVLADHDEAELAYELITRRRFPSYGSVLDHGETTMPEQLISGKNPGSHNHHFLCDYKQWYIKYVGGIRVNPTRRDPNSAVISPCFIKKLDFARADVLLPAGAVETEWKKLGELEYELRVKFDEGIKLTLSLSPDYVICEGLTIQDGKALAPGEHTIKVRTAR